MQLNLIRRPPAVFMGRPPLLVLLHGAGGNAEGMADWALSLDPRFLCLSLQAPFRTGPDAYRWFDLECRHGAIRANETEAEQSRLAVVQHINDAVMGLGADPRRVYLLGFSQGASLAYGIAMTAARKVRGVVGIGGRLLPEFATLATGGEDFRHLTLFIQQALGDPLSTGAQRTRARDFFVERGAMLGYREYVSRQELTTAMRRDTAEFLMTQLDRLDANAGR